ncbi:MAG: NifU family protein [Solirubrobacterales bacterium]
MDEATASAQAGQVESLLGELEELADPEARELALSAVGALVELYGEGLARIRGHLDPDQVAELCEDHLISHLLVVHDLHPASVQERIAEALASVRPYLESHGGGVELLGVDGTVARLRLQGSCDGCPSSAVTLKLAVEDAIRRHAPEIETVEAEGNEAAPTVTLPQVTVPATRNGNGNGAAVAANGNGKADAIDPWTVVGGLPELRDGGTLIRAVGGEPLLFAALGEDRFAYRPTCPSCQASLDTGELTGSELRCPECSSVYDLRRAGRCLDSPRLHLDPVPLLVADSGIAKVAVGGAV